jgi:hypothetical protein
MNWEKYYNKQKKINDELTKISGDMLKLIDDLIDKKNELEMQIEKMNQCDNCNVSNCQYASFIGYTKCDKQELNNENK